MERFVRTEWLIGKEGIARLNAATVAVFGLGGVGAAAVEGLARSGVGTLIIVDHDRVSLSNLNRQLIALTSTVGRLKTEAAEERIKDINPECRVFSYPIFYEKDTDQRYFAGSIMLWMPLIRWERSDLIERCYRSQIPIVSAMGAGNKRSQ